MVYILCHIFVFAEKHTFVQKSRDQNCALFLDRTGTIFPKYLLSGVGLYLGLLSQHYID